MIYNLLSQESFSTWNYINGTYFCIFCTDENGPGTHSIWIYCVIFDNIQNYKKSQELLKSENSASLPGGPLQLCVLGAVCSVSRETRLTECGSVLNQLSPLNQLTSATLFSETGHFPQPSAGSDSCLNKWAQTM